MRFIVGGFIVGAWLCGGVHAQVAETPAATVETASPADVSDVLHPIREKADLPGMAVVVMRGREVIARGVSGMRKRGNEEKVEFGDRWHIGSCTKSMTATLLAVLVEEGKLKWSSTLGEIFPDIEMHDSWKGVTAEQLVAHRAGAPAKLDADGVWGRLWRADDNPREARLAMMRSILKKAPEAEPGTRYLYANSGFMMAGAMAERVCDRGWDDLMREKVFGPLGMTSAGFGTPGTKGSVEQPWGHRANGTPSQGDNPAGLGPAGTVHCSLEDWGRYVAVHTGGWRTDRTKGEWLLKPESIAALHAPYKGAGDSYGFGWAILKRPWGKGPAGDGTVLTHAGSNTMWFAVVWASPEKDMAVLVAANQAGEKAPKACDDVCGAMIGRFFRENK